VSNCKKCNGCATDSVCENPISVTVSKTNKKVECPCVNCIIKTMCNLPCLPYKHYIKLTQGKESCCHLARCVKKGM
jgi:hypothetical protein